MKNCIICIFIILFTAVCLFSSVSASATSDEDCRRIIIQISEICRFSEETSDVVLSVDSKGFKYAGLIAAIETDGELKETENLFSEAHITVVSSGGIYLLMWDLTSDTDYSGYLAKITLAGGSRIRFFCPGMLCAWSSGGEIPVACDNSVGAFLSVNEQCPGLWQAVLYKRFGIDENLGRMFSSDCFLYEYGDGFAVVGRKLYSVGDKPCAPITDLFKDLS